MTPSASIPGVDASRQPRGVDSALADLWWRARESWRRVSGRPTPVCPDGYWTLTEDAATRKEWKGYSRRVRLETSLSLGGGWRVWMDIPDGVLYPVRIRRDGDGDAPAFELRSGYEPSHAPVFPRVDAFSVAERFMSEYAMDHAASSDALAKHGWGGDG
jgi:hypothetical protein